MSYNRNRFFHPPLVRNIADRKLQRMINRSVGGPFEDLNTNQSKTRTGTTSGRICSVHSVRTKRS